MTARATDQRRIAAERLGYRFTVRHQPQADLAESDWIVVVTTPTGRSLFPSAVDDTELAAWQRALESAEADRADGGAGDERA